MGLTYLTIIISDISVFTLQKNHKKNWAQFFNLNKHIPWITTFSCNLLEKGRNCDCCFPWEPWQLPGSPQGKPQALQGGCSAHRQLFCWQHPIWSHSPKQGIGSSSGLHHRAQPLPQPAPSLSHPVLPSPCPEEPLHCPVGALTTRWRHVLLHPVLAQH